MDGDRMCDGESWAGRLGNYFNEGPDEGRACSSRTCMHTLTYIRIHCVWGGACTYVSASPRGPGTGSNPLAPRGEDWGVAAVYECVVKYELEYHQVVLCSVMCCSVMCRFFFRPLFGRARIE
jgi:hypothetical protein